jgi:valyl-tRNA synthetase
VFGWRFAEGADGGAGPLGRVTVDGADLYVPLAGLIDLEEERARLERELERARSELARAQGKLANERFVTRAPADVVQTERDKVDEWQEAVERLDAQLHTLNL